MRDYKKYDVWKLGHEITLQVYRLTKTFTKDEQYGLVSQMRRSAYFIPSNIAEGCGRESDKEFRHYLVISRGSSSELEYFTTLSRDLEYLDKDSFKKLEDEVNKLKRSLNNLIKKI